jgi:alkylation response protein AidB-like acyl-CoA dehydrogenase
VGAVNAGSVCAQAHVIESDSEALEVAGRIGQALAQEAAERDRQRRLPWTEVETLSASGLLGITVPGRFGGPDVSAVPWPRSCG